MVDPVVDPVLCVYCGHPVHPNRCMFAAKILIGSKACTCTSKNNQGPKPPKDRRPPKVNTGEHCDARLLMPLTVAHPCTVVNTKADPDNLKFYRLRLDNAEVPAWLCRPHMLAAQRLAGVKVEAAE